jgi:hypothetical protein
MKHQRLGRMSARSNKRRLRFILLRSGYGDFRLGDRVFDRKTKAEGTVIGKGNVPGCIKVDFDDFIDANVRPRSVKNLNYSLWDG